MSENLNKNNVDDAFAKIFLGEVNIAENKHSEIKSQPIEIEEPKKIEVKDEQEQEDIQEEPKTTEKSEEQQKELLKADLKVEYESLKKQLNDAKSWGHKKNAAYINAKKKITDFLSKLQEDSLINEDEAGLALKAFDEAAISEEELQSNDKGNSYAQLKANLDKEFNIFKKYNKTSELDEKYQAFFGFFPLLPQDEQEKIVNYITSENPEVVIDHIITTGSEIYETVYKGATKSGGIIPFIKSLHAKIEKLEKRNKELESEVDTTEGIVHNRSINSKVSNLASTKQTKNFADIWQN
jgi:biopolymer transport protein ExbD